MAGYRIKFNPELGMLTCRVEKTLIDAEWDDLLRELSVAMRAARGDGPLRLLWDNRAGREMPAAMATKLQSVLKSMGGDGGRVAVIVPDSLAKMRARPRLVDGTALFASENAALTWLLGSSYQSQQRVSNG